MAVPSLNQAPASAWGGYCPQAEQSSFGPPKGIEMSVERAEEIRTINGLPAVRTLGAAGRGEPADREMERCQKFFEGAGSPYMSRELVVSRNFENPTVAEWDYSAADWVYKDLSTSNRAVLQLLPPEGSDKIRILDVWPKGRLELAYRSGTFELKKFEILNRKFVEKGSFTFTEFDSAGKKINEILREFEAVPAGTVLQRAASERWVASSSLGIEWAYHKFPWGCQRFKSKESMMRWVEIHSHAREGVWYTFGEVENKYYMAFLKRDARGRSVSRAEARGMPGVPGVYEVGLRSRPKHFWREPPCPVFLKAGNQEIPLALYAMEEHEYKGKSPEEIRGKEHQAQDKRLREIFNTAVSIADEPVSGCKDNCDALPCSCYYLCCCCCCFSDV